MNIKIMEIDKEIKEYIGREILPRYDSFDKAHRREHALMVIDQSLELVGKIPQADATMAYVVAAFHDLGLVNGRENHHNDSRTILENDKFIRRHFTPDEIELMACAVQDHRASNSKRPRNIYGLIVAEADRFIDAETIVRRTIQYGLAHYPTLDREGHYERTLAHLREKYGRGGYLRIWIEDSANARRLEDLRRIIDRPEQLRPLFDSLFSAES